MAPFPVAMAHDGYRNTPDQQPMNPYPTSMQPPPLPQPPMYSAGSSYPTPYYPESERQRHRNSSPGQRSRLEAAQYQRARQPINDAVSSAVDNADASHTLPPEILSQITSQITADVLRQLKATNSDSSTLNPNSSTAPHIPASTNGTKRSSSVYSESSPTPPHHDVYTPPSPRRPSDEATFSSPTSSIKSSAAFGQDRHSPNNDRTPISTDGRASHAEEVRNDKMERPKTLTRQPTDVTTLEKVWGPLFEGSGPTARLGQFLRGLAHHLIEDYEPKSSLVVTPSKMQRYYEDTKLVSEPYDWQMVFDDRTSAISRLYREVDAEHHLVQENTHEKPDIPGLTPLGFKTWSTLMLLAYPDQEFERLQKAVLDMPICNFDDRRERFPKEISRRLFPKLPDLAIRERLEKALSAHCNASLHSRLISGSESGSQQPQPTSKAHRADSIASNTSSQPSASTLPRREDSTPIAAQGSCAERQRQPYSTTASEGAIDEEDDLPTPQPIERQRKPYAAQPGGGLNYDDINRRSSPSEPRAGSGSPPTVAPATASKLGRSASNASSSGRYAERSQPITINPSLYSRQPQAGVEGLTVPDSTSNSRHHANSLLNHQRATRTRSPSVNTKISDYGGPDGDALLGPSSYGPYSASPSGDVIEERRRRRDYYDNRQSMYELPSRERDREREREAKRYQPNAGYDASRVHYSSDEDYYRPAGGRLRNGQQYYR